MKAGVNSNVMPMLQSVDGLMLVKQQEIEIEVLNFYKCLMGTTSDNIPTIDLNIMRHGPKIIIKQQRDICRAITREEVKAVVFNVDDNKALRIDGYNACFLKKK